MSVIMPGSYDPVTLGHLEMIRRVAEREDEVYVVIFSNPRKKYTFSLDDRMAMLMLATEDLDNVFVSSGSGGATVFLVIGIGVLVAVVAFTSYSNNKNRKKKD